MISPPHLPTNEEIAAHYDSLGEFYREVWGDDLHHGYWVEGNESTEEAIVHLNRTVTDLAFISSGDRVCDVGSGYGGTSIRLAIEEKALVTGWTLSSTQQAAAESLANSLPPDVPKPRFHCEDWIANDLADNSMDAVISIECLSHIADKERFFCEAARLLEPGGRLVLSDWAAPSKPRSWRRQLLLGPICTEGRLAGLADVTELRALAEKAGLEITEAREIGAKVRKTWRVITLRLIRKVVSDSRYRRFLIENLRSDRIFALTIARLLLGFHTRTLDHVVIGARKPL